MADHQVVLGIFADEAAADAAVESLKSWDQATEDIKLGAIGVLVLDDDGLIKERKLGQRSGTLRSATSPVPAGPRRGFFRSCVTDRILLVYPFN